VAGNDSKRPAVTAALTNSVAPTASGGQNTSPAQCQTDPSDMPDQQNPWIGLRSGQLAAQINPLGAQLSVLQDASGRDLLWNGDPAVWAGRAPILFPIIGTLAGGRYRVGSKEYRLPRHGF